MNVDELIQAFQQLSATEQKELFKRIMPTLCELFKSDPQQMLAEMMPLCREMAQGCGIDPQMLMGLMAIMNNRNQ